MPSRHIPDLGSQEIICYPALARICSTSNISLLATIVGAAYSAQFRGEGIMCSRLVAVSLDELKTSMPRLAGALVNAFNHDSERITRAQGMGKRDGSLLRIER